LKGAACSRSLSALPRPPFLGNTVKGTNFGGLWDVYWYIGKIDKGTSKC
jgi:hypothetical protein